MAKNKVRQVAERKAAVPGKTGSDGQGEQTNGPLGGHEGETRGVTRAAMLMIGLGNKAASEITKHLSDEELEDISARSWPWAAYRRRKSSI